MRARDHAKSASPPAFDRRGHADEDLAIAARSWGGLLAQEERSRLVTARMSEALRSLGAPADVLEAACRVAEDEARHVDICAHVVRALGFEPTAPAIQLAPLPADAEGFARAVTEMLVAGFAVAETMSVGGFTAVRRISRERLARWALGQIARDEVRHGAFGELASAWALRDWSAGRRQELWELCVRAMEDVERRAGGPAQPGSNEVRRDGLEALGVPARGTTTEGLVQAVSRWVLPRLERLGVLPKR
jgi:hypothetical protein